MERSDYTVEREVTKAGDAADGDFLDDYASGGKEPGGGLCER